MDRHEVPGATADDLARAHAADVGTQQNYGVRYLTYWFDPDAGSVFCLAEGPSRQAVEDVHPEAHGLLATTILEVEPGDVRSFFGPMPSHPVGEAYVESAVRAILFTDMCGSTELTSTLGDDEGTALVLEHDVIVRRALADHRGREVKHTGDGIMASFTSVAAAVESGIDVQRAMTRRNEAASVPVDVRIGISAGEPITDAGDLFGATVQLAARLCAYSPPGKITVSVAVRELCQGKRLVFVDGGTVELKGFAEPATCYEVAWT
jgi:class 3 adenylate cyclase